MSCTLFLASSSPQRSRILKALGFEFSVIHPDIDESVIEDESAYDYVVRLAIQKSQIGTSLLSQNREQIVLGADTCVAVDNMKLGKPLSSKEAMSMLEMLSGREHQVHSAVAVSRGSEVHALVDTTTVKFRILNQLVIDEYLRSGEYENRAGAYAIQGLAADFVEELKGSLSGVVGLPVKQTLQLLRRFGLDVPEMESAKERFEMEFPVSLSVSGNYAI